MKNFKDLVLRYLDESNETIQSKIKARKEREEGFKKEFEIDKGKKGKKINIKISGRSDIGRRLSDEDTALGRDDPSFMLRSISKKIRYGKKEEEKSQAKTARDDGEFFADILMAAKSNPELRKFISDARINPAGDRDSFINAYVKANRMWEIGDEGKRMKELKKLYFNLKKELGK